MRNSEELMLPGNQDGRSGQTYSHYVIVAEAVQFIRGFRYLARQDSGWNGAIKDCEFFVSDSPDRFGKPVAKATFEKTRKSQQVNCDPVPGRYALLRALSEVNGGPGASVAELGVVGR